MASIESPKIIEEEPKIDEDAIESKIYKEKDKIYLDKDLVDQNIDEQELGEEFNDILLQNLNKPADEKTNEQNKKEFDKLKDIKSKKIDDRVYSALKYCDFANKLAIDENLQIDLILKTFELFSKGDRQKLNLPWLDYLCFKELMRISRIIPSEEIPDFKVDMIYIDFTTQDSGDFINPIVQQNFKDLLALIATIRYPEETKQDSLSKLLRFHIFPYLLWNMENIQNEYQNEWNYCLYLMKKHGLRDEENITLKELLIQKRDMTKLLKNMSGMFLLDPEKRKLFEITEKLKEKNNENPQEEEQNKKEIEIPKDKKLEEEKEFIELDKKKENEIQLLKAGEETNEEEEKFKKEAEKFQKEEDKINQELELKLKEEEEILKKEQKKKEIETKRKRKFFICNKFVEFFGFFFKSFCVIQTNNQDIAAEILETENSEEVYHAIGSNLAISNRKRVYDHKESPPWPDITNQIVEFIPEAEKEYSKKKFKDDSLRLIVNTTNILAIFSKVA